MPHESPGSTLLDPKLHVDDAGLVRFAQKYSLNRLIAPYGRFESILPEIPSTPHDHSSCALTTSNINVTGTCIVFSGLFGIKKPFPSVLAPKK